MNCKKLLTIVFLLSFFASNRLLSTSPEGGMFPLSEIHKIDLQKAGLKINPIEIYNPKDTSLIDALVKVGGCTGSFISDKGLVLTNHHCAFRAISKASTSENNYLENGYLATTFNEEIPAKGTKIRITESYEDVSELVLKSIEGVDDLTKRTKIIKTTMDKIGESANDIENSIEGKVSEMFKGKTYVLFRYRIIKDVRIVYTPPRSIGEFGGETDNWVWPRHTGDFTFMRAYVAPDGSAAEYSNNNIPYQPKKFLKVNPNGIKENDFAFILGYPAKTYRNLPSYFLEYQKNYNLPYISTTYDWMINQLSILSKDDNDLKLKFASMSKKLANIAKNYKGKLKGLRKIKLVEQKQIEENNIQNFINNDENLKENYGELFKDFKNIYIDQNNLAYINLWFKVFNKYSTGQLISNLIMEYCQQIQLPDSDHKLNFKEEKLEQTKLKFSDYLNNYNIEFERRFLNYMFNQSLNFSGISEIETISSIAKKQSIEDFVNLLLKETAIFDLNNIEQLLLECPDNYKDEFLKFSNSLNINYYTQKTEFDRISGGISKLSGKLYEIKKLWNDKNFIPDANGTLRLTFGYIKGYSPSDAVYMHPITTLNGVIEKNYLGGEYEIPDKLKVLYETQDFGQFYSEDLKSIPVGILYNMDTTGGNSGSPILNADGELVGLNFDRAYEATINDFAWNESYSRSIGVDIRYILWLTQKLGGANYLLQEMGIN